MTKMKLTALPVIIFSTIIMLGSCSRKVSEEEVTFSKSGIVMSGANEAPANPSSAVGSLNVSYNKLSKILTYNFSWSGLAGPVSAFHIHGLASPGFSTGVFQTFTTSAIVPCKVNGVPGPTTCGSYSGTLFIDGYAIKEEDLLNGMYYVNIHDNGTNPNGGTYSGGEIRGQITFK